MTTIMGTVQGTTPYAWPCTGPLDPARTALLVVNSPATDLRTIGGLHHFTATVRHMGVLVVEVSVTDPWGRIKRISGLQPSTVELRCDVEVAATGWDGFHDSSLESVLRRHGRDTILLCGAHLEVGVHSTLRSANDRGYEVLLMQDLCLEADPSLRPAALSSIEMSGGIFGAIGTSAAVLDTLAVSTSHAS